ncbi:VanZ family protein [Modestobacter roseus]|uniref:Glycopeptide antibiotics resistance protein n=1 Tax=Modestobacter roseus TaxID=1181884 RepID=A0A562IM04_9ACTN|nr:VanZ family protein [Modestobacter roseus]MQA32259.1 VanZ family protein [Modestobacter roseus]TWH71755.1 glycopeptide antibiotics resistance protein [Modestobacter roseus]
MFRQVPVIPVVVPSAAVLFVALLWHLHRRDRLTVPRAAVALVLCGYLAGIVANTVFPVFLDKPVADGSWATSFNLVPLAGYEVADALVNVLVLVPVGVLVPLLRDTASWWQAVAAGAGLSLAIELTQLLTDHFLSGGHIADVNDLVFNVLGAALGAGLFRALSRVPRVAALVDRVRWRGTRPTSRSAVHRS